MLTREYPPEVYGGAGVHVEYLSRELASLEGIDIEVHAFGAPRADDLVQATYRPWNAVAASPTLATMSIDLEMALRAGGADLVHTHTWYANLGGHLASMLHGIPHVMTAHSLEPLRPWKAEQLGGGYALSSWCERVSIESADAVVAVSAAMRDDILAAFPAVDRGRVHVIHNGIDADEYRPTDDRDTLARYGIRHDRPFALFVGRMTRQKGIAQLLESTLLLRRDHVVVVIASSPDTSEVGAELRELAALVASSTDRGQLVWIERVPPRDDVVALLSLATVFVCPSVYEPFGLVNIEAMACETAVVASAVGGIPEIVVDGETGTLVSVDGGVGFTERLALAVASLLDDPELASRYGKAGRQRVLDRFTWRAIAHQTADLYRTLT